MTARRVRTSLIVVAILMCLATLVVAESSRARIVRLSYLDGDARIDQGTGQGEQRAILNMPVVEGTRLMAEEGGRVEVEFENGSTVRLVGPAEVVFRELSLQDGNRVSLLEVTHGLVYFDIARKGDDDFRVTVQNHNLDVHKSSHFRVDATSDSANVSVFKGELNLLDAPDTVAVKKGETISFDNTDLAHYALAKDIDSLGADVWDHDRAQDRETYARSEAYKNSLGYADSPYSYGMYDLAYYGNWFSGPGGACWRPSGYGFGWDPFSQGAWNYYPSNGWVFVSSYPWGWTPYRYGAWNWFNGTGWCWSPGGYYNWNVYPVIITQPPAFQGIRPPGKPPGPPVFIGGRKTPPPPGPDSFRKPVKGFDRDPDVPVGRKGLPPVLGAPGQPTGERLPTPMPPPGRKAWGNTERGPGRGERVSPNPTGATGNPMPTPAPKSDAPRVTPPTPRVDSPRSTPPAPRMDSPRVTPSAPPPRVETPRATPAPMPRMESPRMAPAPAPTPHVEPAKPH